MTDETSFPPWQKLSPDEVRLGKQHLLNEIATEARELKPVLPTARYSGWRRLCRPALSGVRSVLVVPVVLFAALALVPIGGASLGARAVHGVTSLWDSPPNQPALDAAASDAESVAGSAYYTGAVVNDSANTVDLYLANAPQSIIDQLQSSHPGIYVIHNDAAHSLSQLRHLESKLPLDTLSAKGIDVVRVVPTPDGYLSVGVTSTSNADVLVAQSALDSAAGAGVVKVYGGAQASVSAVRTSHYISPSEWALAKRLEHRRRKH